MGDERKPLCNQIYLTEKFVIFSSKKPSENICFACTTRVCWNGSRNHIKRDKCYKMARFTRQEAKFSAFYLLNLSRTRDSLGGPLNEARRLKLKILAYGAPSPSDLTRHQLVGPCPLGPTPFESAIKRRRNVYVCTDPRCRCFRSSFIHQGLREGAHGGPLSNKKLSRSRKRLLMR